MKNKRIALFMLPLLTQGAGAEKYFVNLARNLAKNGVRADVVTMDEEFFKKFARFLHILTYGNFFKEIDISGRESEAEVASQLGEAKWIKSSYKDLKGIFNDYDIIYSKNELVDLAIIKSLGYKKIPPVIVGVHTPIFYPTIKSLNSRIHNFLYLGIVYRWLLKGAACIHLSNKFTKDLIDSKFKIKSSLIYYPFSGASLVEAAEKNPIDIEFEKNKNNIVFIGRLAEQKGIGALINLIEMIARDKCLSEKIKINIFGSGDSENESLVREAEKKNDFVKWYGHIENKYVPGILVKQDLFITTAKWETLPFNVLEAQSLGLPVIAFDIPGPNDIIANGQTGCLVSDEKEFYTKISDFVDGKITFDKSVIQQNIKNKFDPDKIHDELFKMFDSNC